MSARELFRHQQTTLRFALIGVIILAMLIPLAMVEGVTEERQSYFNATVVDIANAWGNAQNVTGPFLIIPEVCRYQERNQAGQMVWRERRTERIVLPSELKLDADIAHQLKKRAIYQVPVYTAGIRIEGSFPALDPAWLTRDGVTVLIDEARLVLGISHSQAISSATDVSMGTTSVPLRAGTGHAWIGTGVNAAVPDLSVQEPLNFSFELQLKGSRRLGFTPVGGQTGVSVSSSWPHPGFGGAYLPDRSEVSDAGFTASWTVHELARDLPGSWLAGEEGIELGGSLAYINLFQPVTGYRVVDRAIKYGLLFIALTFLGFVCFELITDLRFHPVQYGVVGAGLVLFYLALLSLSEHVVFGLAYLIATSLLTGLIAWYVWAMTAIGRLCAWMTCIVLGLYATLYVLLQLEAFALLVGTGVLFVGLLGLMFTTRSLTRRLSDDEGASRVPA